MPNYDYCCDSCGTEFEVSASISEKEKGIKPLCPKCGKDAKQLFKRLNVVSSSGDENMSMDDMPEDEGMPQGMPPMMPPGCGGGYCGM